MPRFEPFHYADDPGIWQLTAKHKNGSVEAAVGALRRRNLMVSFGVLSVLAVTMGLILIASQRARRLARLQMEFVAGISHELRTPLAEFLLQPRTLLTAWWKTRGLVRYGNTIVRQSRQLTQLVEQVLLFASTQQSQARIGLGPLNIAEVIAAALEGTSAIVTAAGFTLERHVVRALTDKGRLYCTCEKSPEPCHQCSEIRRRQPLVAGFSHFSKRKRPVYGSPVGGGRPRNRYR